VQGCVALSYVTNVSYLLRAAVLCSLKDVGQAAVLGALKDYINENDHSIAEKEELRTLRTKLKDQALWNTIDEVIHIMKPLLDIHGELTLVCLRRMSGALSYYLSFTRTHTLSPFATGLDSDARHCVSSPIPADYQVLCGG
jgi:hypothetical protein